MSDSPFLRSFYFLLELSINVASFLATPMARLLCALVRALSGFLVFEDLAVDAHYSWGVYASFCGCLRSGDFWGLLSVLLGLTEHWRLATGRRVSRSYFLSCLPSVRVVVLTSRSSIRPILITLSPFHFPPAIGFGLRNEQGTLMASGIPSVAF